MTVVETREMDMNASQHPMEPRVALVSVYTAADNTAVIRRRVDEAVRLNTYLDAICEVSNPVIRRAAAELCMAVADAEHDQLWDVITANGATNSRLMRERDEARATIERVRALHTSKDNDRDVEWCAHDMHGWPCPTIRALEIIEEEDQ